MASNLNTIVLVGNGHHLEGEADAAITPGMAVEMAADGLFDPPQGTQAETLKGGLFIAKEADLNAGKTITDAYADGDILFYYAPNHGDVVHVFVKALEDIDIGDKLVVEAGGSGLFVEAAGTETKYQLEALEGPGSLAANTHVRCRVIAP